MYAKTGREFQFPENILQRQNHLWHQYRLWPMAQYRIEDESLSQLQYNIIRSHATGAGQPLPERYVKAAMIARLYTFLQGNPAYIKNWRCSLPSLSTGGLFHTYPNTAVWGPVVIWYNSPISPSL